jgi:lysozyme
MNPPMQYDGAGLALTEQGEGLRLQAYQDSGGVWTCGYGHTSGVGPSTTCTIALAAEWLEQDTQEAVSAINQLVTVQLTQPEFDALVDFVFNIGSTQFSKSTMLDLLNAGNITGAALQFQRWDLCGGKVVAGLLNRRIAEQNEFNS